MSLFEITPDESAAQSNLIQALTDLRLAEQATLKFPLDDLSEGAQAARAAVDAARRTVDLVSGSSILQRAGLKQRLNSRLEQSTFGIPSEVMFELAEEALAKLDGPQGERLFQILRTLVTKTIRSSSDEVILKERAESLARRYRAYTSVGLPLEFVHAWLLREEGESYGGLGMSMVKQGVELLQLGAGGAGTGYAVDIDDGGEDESGDE